MVTHRDPGNGPEDRTPRTGQLTATTSRLTTEMCSDLHIHLTPVVTCCHLGTLILCPICVLSGSGVSYLCPERHPTGPRSPTRRGGGGGPRLGDATARPTVERPRTRPLGPRPRRAFTPPPVGPRFRSWPSISRHGGGRSSGSSASSSDHPPRHRGHHHPHRPTWPAAQQRSSATGPADEPIADGSKATSGLPVTLPAGRSCGGGLASR